MKKNVIIGISPRFYKDDSNTFIRVNFNYIEQLNKRGASSIILVPNCNISEVLNMCDGFLVIGGDDFDPIIYGQNNNSNLSKGVDHQIDEIDKLIIKHAVKFHKPLLGICRGHQALAAILGGSLYQDIEACKLNHPHADKKHVVEKVSSGSLADLLPNNFIVNTYHHQAVNKLPDNFRATFINGDIIEAIEHVELPIIGVQWHPERMTTEETKIIFDYFINKC